MHFLVLLSIIVLHCLVFKVQFLLNSFSYNSFIRLYIQPNAYLCCDLTQILADKTFSFSGAVYIGTQV